MQQKEAIYIAGPECFYSDGNAQLEAMRRLAEAHGHTVTLPNDTKLDLDHADLRENADTIFRNCAESMNASTAIICDLEFYRGAEPDGGSVFELGMAAARGIRCYGYTRDKRAMHWKYQGADLRSGTLYDRKQRSLPYAQFPFSPNLMGAVKIVEGDFARCLSVMELDIEQQQRDAALRRMADLPCGQTPHLPAPTARRDAAPVLLLAGPDRYAPDAAARYACMKEICTRYGFRPLTPLDMPAGLERFAAADGLDAACLAYAINRQHVVDCDVVLADLNDFHGWEPESDTAFECGMAYQLGKRLYATVDSVVRMRDRVPNLGQAHGWRDACGCAVENFDYPLNLMFSSSMQLSARPFEDVVRQIAEDMGLR